MDESLTPCSVQEAETILQDKIEEKQSVAVVGKNQRGLSIPDGMTTVSSQKLKNLIFFNKEDLVIGVQAGMEAGELQQILQEQGLRLHVNPTRKETTVGSMIACNDAGPTKMFMGGLRDYVIGIEYINGLGVNVRGGGKVVKNVAGYDLMKLMLGSRGGYGMITQVNFKVMPVPLAPKRYFKEYSNLQWQPAVEKLAQTRTPVSSLQVTYSDGKYTVCIGYDGSSGKIGRIENDLRQLFGEGEILEFDSIDKAQYTSVSDENYGYQEPFKKMWGCGSDHFHAVVFTKFSSTLESDVIEGFAQIDKNIKLLLFPFSGVIEVIAPYSEETDITRLSTAIKKTLPQIKRYSLLSPTSPKQIQCLLSQSDDEKLALRLKQSLDPNNLFHSPYFESLKKVFN